MRQELMQEYNIRESHRQIAWASFVGTGGLVLTHMADRLFNGRTVASDGTEIPIMGAAFLAALALGSISKRRMRVIESQIQNSPVGGK